MPETADAPRCETIAIQVIADADADAFARIANVILLANTPPWRVLLNTVGGEVHVEIELRDVDDSIAERIRRKLMQLTCVTEIEMHVGASGVFRYRWRRR